MTEPKFLWYPWRDPLARDLNRKEQAAWEEQFKGVDIIYEDEDGELEGFDDVVDTKIKGIATQVGVIPYSENTNPYVLFDFFTGHTNFTITPKILEIIEKTEGVEYLTVYSRYRFRVCIGKIFALNKDNHDPRKNKSTEILLAIQNNIKNYLKIRNKRVATIKALLGYNK